MATLFAQPDALEINHFWGFRDNVGLKDQLTIFDDYPSPSLFDTSQAAPAKTLRINLQWINTAFSKSKLSLNRHHEIQLAYSRGPQTGNRFANLERPTQ